MRDNFTIRQARPPFIPILSGSSRIDGFVCLQKEEPLQLSLVPSLPSKLQVVTSTDVQVIRKYGFGAT